MKKTLITLLLLLALLIQPASAITFSELELAVNEYNENADQAPSLIKNMLGNEVVHLLIEMNDGSELHIKAITENALITTFEDTGTEEDIEATLKVTIKENIVDQLLASENPLEVFYNAMENKDIVIEPTGFVDTIKFQVASVLLKLSELLGLI